MAADSTELDPRIARLKTPESCEQFARNVEVRGKPELALAARRRAIELRAQAHNAKSDAEREALEAIYAYERTLFVKHKKNVRATRTWRMVERLGIVQAVERVVSRGAESTGYRALTEMGMRDKSFEAVVLRHPTVFGPEAVRRAQKRLSEE
jgi:hypothetical protein